jgi:putative flippase GtrA
MKVQDLKKYLIFIVGGGIGALVNWFLSFVLTSLLAMYYLFSFLIAQIVNIVVNFTWHRYVTFRDRGHSLGQFTRFFTMSICTVSLSIGLVFVIKEFVIDHIFELIVLGYKINYLLAIVSVTFLVSVINFVVCKTWIFRNNPPDLR